MLQNKLIYLKPAFTNISLDWQDLLNQNCHDALVNIDKQLLEVSKTNIIYPPSNLIFNALYKTPLKNTKVVILGQDPYHGDGEANGLAFSVNNDIKIPPSLRNIFKELALETGYQVNLSGEKLNEWATQGVLLLNSSLTVIKDKPNSLAHIGWQYVTDQIIYAISNNCNNIVFMLWGGFAQKKATLINQFKHLILSSTHPSPLSAHRGFIGCNHFNLANEYLSQNAIKPIMWV